MQGSLTLRWSDRVPVQADVVFFPTSLHKMHVTFSLHSETAWMFLFFVMDAVVPIRHYVRPRTLFTALVPSVLY